jgi:PilZ domain-containing protein
VFVHTAQRVPVGTELGVRFTVLLDDPVVIEARGRVVRHQLDPGGIGIAFTQLSPDMALRIDDVLTRQRPRDLGRPLQADASAAARRHSAPPASGDTRVMRTPQPVEDEPNDELDGYKTQVRLRAVDVEILDEDAVLDDDAADGEREP